MPHWYGGGELAIDAAKVTLRSATVVAMWAVEATFTVVISSGDSRSTMVSLSIEVQWADMETTYNVLAVGGQDRTASPTNKAIYIFGLLWKDRSSTS